MYHSHSNGIYWSARPIGWQSGLCVNVVLQRYNPGSTPNFIPSAATQHGLLERGGCGAVRELLDEADWSAAEARLELRLMAMAIPILDEFGVPIMWSPMLPTLPMLWSAADRFPRVDWPEQKCTKS